MSPQQANKLKEAVEVVVKLLHSATEQVRLDAATAIVNRPVQDKENTNV